MSRTLVVVGVNPDATERIRDAFAGGDAPWAVVTATTGDEALALLAARAPDAVVVGSGIPRADGRGLLEWVRGAHPATARLLHVDGAAPTEETSVAHGVISNRVTTEAMRESVVRMAQLQRLVGAEVVRKVVGNLQSLPSAPRMYSTLVEALERPQVTTRELATIVESDPAMVAKLLKIVGSASFYRTQRPTSVVQAINLIGFDMLKGLVLGAHVFSSFSARPVSGFSVDLFQRYSVRVASVARQLVAGPEVEHAFAAALLHDVGKMVVALRMPGQNAEIARRVAKTGTPGHIVEREVIGGGHAEVGAALLASWGLPRPVVEAVAYHHQPSAICVERGDYRVVAAVHAADALLDALEAERDVRECVDTVFLERVGLARELPAWRRIAEKALERADD